MRKCSLIFPPENINSSKREIGVLVASTPPATKTESYTQHTADYLGIVTVIELRAKILASSMNFATYVVPGIGWFKNGAFPNCLLLLFIKRKDVFADCVFLSSLPFLYLSISLGTSFSQKNVFSSFFFYSFPLFLKDLRLKHDHKLSFNLA